MKPLRFLAVALVAAFAAVLAASCIRHVDLMPVDAAILDAQYHPDVEVDASVDAALVGPDASPDSAIDAQ